jgi:hypothetical protein
VGLFPRGCDCEAHDPHRNILLKRLGPHRVLPYMSLAFGLITCFQGFVRNTGGLIAARCVQASLPTAPAV